MATVLPSDPTLHITPTIPMTTALSNAPVLQITPTLLVTQALFIIVRSKAIPPNGSAVDNILKDNLGSAQVRI